MSAASVPRPQCTACLRPLSACICHWVAPTDHAVEVLVLQHPLEVHQAKGSARLLHLSLAHCRLVVGEAFAAPVWPVDGKHTLLLYPDSLQDTAPDLRVPPRYRPSGRKPRHACAWSCWTAPGAKAERCSTKARHCNSCPAWPCATCRLRTTVSAKPMGLTNCPRWRRPATPCANWKAARRGFSPCWMPSTGLSSTWSGLEGQRDAQTDKSCPRPRVMAIRWAQ